MKINRSVDTTATGKPGTPAGSPPPVTPANGSVPQGDTIELSALMSELKASVCGSESFDRTKVEAIKAAISEGRLSVNPEAIAERMLADARARLGRTRK